MLALDVLHSQSPRRVDALLTTVVEGEDVVTAHGTPLSLIERQAERLSVPLFVMRVPREASNEVYERRLEQAMDPMLARGTPTVVAGDLFLEDVKTYREAVLSSSGARPLFPLWKRDTEWLSRRFLERGYQAVVTSVDTTQLGSSFAGRAYDQSFLDDLPEGVDPCGEHGEFHTFVTAGPALRSSIDVVAQTQGRKGGRMRSVRLGLRNDTEDETRTSADT